MEPQVTSMDSTLVTSLKLMPVLPSPPDPGVPEMVPVSLAESRPEPPFPMRLNRTVAACNVDAEKRTKARKRCVFMVDESLLAEYAGWRTKRKTNDSGQSIRYAVWR